MFSQVFVGPQGDGGGFPACITVHMTKGGSASEGSASREGLPAGDWADPSELGKWVVHILLKCFLVLFVTYDASKCGIRCQLIKGITFHGCRLYGPFLISNNTAKTKLAILAFLYRGEIIIEIKNPFQSYSGSKSL